MFLLACNGDLWSRPVLGLPTRAFCAGVLRKTGTNSLVIASEAWRSAFSKALRLTRASTLRDILVSSQAGLGNLILLLKETYGQIPCSVCPHALSALGCFARPATNSLVIASEAWRSAFSKALRLTRASTLRDNLVWLSHPAVSPGRHGGPAPTAVLTKEAGSLIEFRTI